MTTKSVLQIATEIMDVWLTSRGIRASHRTALIAMIAEKLSEQRKAGYKAGMMRAGGIVVARGHRIRGAIDPTLTFSEIRAEAEKEKTWPL